MFISNLNDIPYCSMDNPFHAYKVLIYYHKGWNFFRWRRSFFKKFFQKTKKKGFFFEMQPLPAAPQAAQMSAGQEYGIKRALSICFFEFKVDI